MTSSYENEREEKYSNRRIDDLESNNPWLQNKTTDDIDRLSSKIADHYIDNHLRGEPDGCSSNKMKRELEAFYQTTEPTLVRYTLRKIAHSPKTYSSITDFTKSDEYFVIYKRD
jgi:hypothetical protein